MKLEMDAEYRRKDRKKERRNVDRER